MASLGKVASNFLIDGKVVDIRLQGVPVGLIGGLGWFGFEQFPWLRGLCQGKMGEDLKSESTQPSCTRDTL